MAHLEVKDTGSELLTPGKRTSLQMDISRDVVKYILMAVGNQKAAIIC